MPWPWIIHTNAMGSYTEGNDYVITSFIEIQPVIIVAAHTVTDVVSDW